MFTPRHIMADRLLAVGLVVLTVGLGGALYVALNTPASRVRDEEPVRSAAAEEAPRKLTDADLRILGLGREKPSLRTDAAKTAAKLARRDSAKESVPFKLRGVVYSTAGASVAFIEWRKSVQLYRTGEPVGKWQITAIGMYSVTFSRDGKSRVLSLAHRPYRSGLDLAAAATDGRAASPASGVVSRREKRRKIAVRQTVVTHADRARRPRRAASDWPKRSTVVVPRELATRLRRDPKAALKDARLEVMSEKGRMRGIRIRKLPSIAMGYGLVSGDVVRAVEGQPISSVDRALALYNRYRSSASIRVTVERKGQVRDIIFHAR